MIEIKRYTPDVNGEMWESNTGNYSLYSEVEALQKRIKELEEQLQKKQVDVDKYKEMAADQEDVNKIAYNKNKILDNQLSSYKNLMYRCISALDNRLLEFNEDAEMLRLIEEVKSPNIKTEI